MNTLAVSRRLTQARADPRLAEEQAQILLDITQDLASKKDMQDFKASMKKDMQDFKASIKEEMQDFKDSVDRKLQDFKEEIKQQRVENRWLFGLIFIAIGVLMTLLKIF